MLKPNLKDQAIKSNLICIKKINMIDVIKSGGIF